MDLISFLAHRAIGSLGHIFCFVTPQQPYFLGMLLKKKFEQSFESVASITCIEEEASCKALLEMSFLGSRKLYWLSEDVLATLQAAYIKNYKGPHAIGFFCQTDFATKMDDSVKVELPVDVSFELFMALFAYIYPSKAQKYTVLVNRIFKRYATIPLDMALHLIQYCVLLGSNADRFIDVWLPSLFPVTVSLFSLSTHFFAKRRQQFFELWHSISEDYSEVFWTAFWSEQLFRASLYVTYMQEKNFSQAKKIAYKLPFSFIQKDWKLTTAKELSQVHEQLYTIDWNIKNGLHAHFEYFYLQFMLA